jgi:hypothetical protein
LPAWRLETDGGGQVGASALKRTRPRRPARPDRVARAVQRDDGEMTADTTVRRSCARGWALALAVAVAGAGCAGSGGAAAPAAAPWDGAARWRGPAADAANLALRGPATPALRALRGRVPLAYVTRGPWSEARPFEPVYELALYDDGTVVYEGHRCVRLGGLVFTRLDAQEVSDVRQLLATSCADLDLTSEDELCPDPGSLRVSCSNGRELLTGSDHCRRDAEQGTRLAALAADLIGMAGALTWLGAPTERQACEPGNRDLAPRELAEALPPTLLGPRTR